MIQHSFNPFRLERTSTDLYTLTFLLIRHALRLSTSLTYAALETFITLRLVIVLSNKNYPNRKQCNETSQIP